MQRFFGVQHIKRQFPSPVLAIGVFDGVHRGHQRVFAQVRRRAAALKGTSMAMTFHPHPAHVLRPGSRRPLLISLEQRLQLMEECGIDAAVVVRFTKAFSRLLPEQFIRRYLVNPIKPEFVVVGDDFRFGQDRSGSLEVFRAAGRECGFEVNAVPTGRNSSKLVSSSRVRELIFSGRIRQAARFLGRPVTVRGTVCHGDRRGQGLGYPTANVKTGDVVLPPQGVYAVSVRYGKKNLMGMANIGTRPSFSTGGGMTLEVHLFDFSGNLYGEVIDITFCRRLRAEKTFSSPERLIRQLDRDEKKARLIFAAQ